MTLRILMTIALATGLAACSGDGGTNTNKDDGGTTDTNTNKDNGTKDTTTSAPTGETGGTTGGGGFQAQYLDVEADMGFDGATNTLVTVSLSGTDIPPAIYLLFGDLAWKDAGFDGTLSNDYCFFAMPLTSSGFASWAQANPKVFFGVDYTGGVDGVQTNCGDATHDMVAALGTNDIRDQIVNGYGGWGVGVGENGPLFDSITSTDLSLNFIGAFIENADFLVPSDNISTGQDHYYSLPVKIDPTTFEAQDDGTNFLLVPPNQVFDGTSLHTAWYRIFDFYSWQLY